MALLVSAVYADQSACRVVTYESDGLGYGTGTLFEYRGQDYVVTNAHVVRDAPNRVGLFWPKYEDERPEVSGMLRSGTSMVSFRLDDTRDIAILIPDRRLPIQPVTLPEEPFGEELQDLVSTGYGNPDHPIRTQSFSLSRSAPGGGFSVESVVAPISLRKGDSGSGVLTRNRELVTVLWGSDNRGSSYANIPAVFHEYVTSVLNKRGSADWSRHSAKAREHSVWLTQCSPATGGVCGPVYSWGPPQPGRSVTIRNPLVRNPAIRPGSVVSSTPLPSQGQRVPAPGRNPAPEVSVNVGTKPKAEPSECVDADARARIAALEKQLPKITEDIEATADVLVVVKDGQKDISSRLDAALSRIGATEDSLSELSKVGSDTGPRLVQIERSLVAIQQSLPKTHYVVVAKPNSPQWDSVKYGYAAAAESSASLRVAPPPAAYRGTLPRLVVYSAGTPVRDIVGAGPVRSALGSISKGENP